MSGREAINYAARARASLSLALTCFEHFYGLLRPGEDIAFQHTSILVRPHQKPRASRDMWWSRRVLPPGPLRLLHDTIYHHSRANPAKPIWDKPPHYSTSSLRRRPDERPWVWRPAGRALPPPHECIAKKRPKSLPVPVPRSFITQIMTMGLWHADSDWPGALRSL